MRDNRTKKVEVRVNSKEEKILKLAAEIVGKPLSTFIRQAALLNSAIQVSTNHFISSCGEREHPNPSKSELQGETEYNIKVKKGIKAYRKRE